jgi:hypothetical protein
MLKSGGLTDGVGLYYPGAKVFLGNGVAGRL